MKVQRAPLVAASLIFLAGAVMPPAYTQLPPTNMGKWVHQPGDNQYGSSAQNSRHALPPQAAPVTSFSGGGGGYSSGWSPAPRPFKPDVSLDPIAADEPVPPAGFPPLPDRLDLPVQSSWAGGSSKGGWGGGGGGGQSYGGASAPGMAGGGVGGNGVAQQTGSHQHYGHFEPGSFGQSASHGYYKANTPPPPGSDYYASGSGGGAGAPGTGGAAPSDAEMALRRMGKEPKLNNKADVPGTPEAPQPVVVNQATTQDLSLPEDDFAYQKPGQNNTMGKRLGRSVKRAVLRPLNSAGSYAGISF